MTNINPEPGHVNVSTYAFHEWARHYYQCVQDFAHSLVTRSWSPVPYALLCRAIELELKARHLELTPGQPAMKKFGHDLEKAYDALPANQKVLTVIERDLLRKTNDVYIDDKGFDYVQVGDIATAYSRFPDLASLDALAKKLLGL